MIGKGKRVPKSQIHGLISLIETLFYLLFSLSKPLSGNKDMYSYQSEIGVMP
jgi:hypothetical protein